MKPLRDFWPTQYNKIEKKIKYFFKCQIVIFGFKYREKQYNNIFWHFAYIHGYLMRCLAYLFVFSRGIWNKEIMDFEFCYL